MVFLILCFDSDSCFVCFISGRRDQFQIVYGAGEHEPYRRLRQEEKAGKEVTRLGVALESVWGR